MSNQSGLEKELAKRVFVDYNRKKGRFTLSFGDLAVEQNVCEFLQTVSFVVGKNIEEHLLNPDVEFDMIRIPLTGAGKTVTLSLSDFVLFRQAYEHQLFLLKLEDMLLHRGVRLPASN